jgi:uncharacterized sporulation protein YeaH/YhbH (DUF444 family)
MSEKNLFEIATRNKYRFVTMRGNVTAEDLWDLSLPDLDQAHRGYVTEIRAASEDSLLTQRDGKNDVLENKRDLILFVVRAKQAEAEARKSAKERREKAARVRELLAQRQDADLAAKPAEELQTLLAELEA